LKNLLRWSFFTSIYICSRIWIILCILHIFDHICRSQVKV